MYITNSDSFVLACEDNDIEFIKNTSLENIEWHDVRDGFNIFCRKNNLSMVKHFCKEFEKIEPCYGPMHEILSNGLSHACEKGHLRIIKYLMNNPDISEKIIIGKNINDFLLDNCVKSQSVDTFFYVLNNEDIKNHTYNRDEKEITINAYFKSCLHGNHKLLKELFVRPESQPFIQAMSYDEHLKCLNGCLRGDTLSCLEFLLIENKEVFFQSKDTYKMLDEMKEKYENFQSTEKYARSILLQRDLDISLEPCNKKLKKI